MRLLWGFGSTEKIDVLLMERKAEKNDLLRVHNQVVQLRRFFRRLLVLSKRAKPRRGVEGPRRGWGVSA
jgi:hypothetical protein